MGQCALHTRLFFCGSFQPPYGALFTDNKIRPHLSPHIKHLEIRTLIVCLCLNIKKILPICQIGSLCILIYKTEPLTNNV